MRWETAADRIEKSEGFMRFMDRWSTILGYVFIAAALLFLILLPVLARIVWG